MQNSRDSGDRNNHGCLVCRVRRKKCPLPTNSNPGHGESCSTCVDLNIECWRAPFRPNWMQNPEMLKRFKDIVKAWVANRQNRHPGVPPLRTVSGRFHELPVPRVDEPLLARQFVPSVHEYSDTHYWQTPGFAPSPSNAPFSPLDSFLNETFASVSTPLNLDSITYGSLSHWREEPSTQSPSPIELFRQYQNPMISSPHVSQGYSDMLGSIPPSAISYNYPFYSRDIDVTPQSSIAQPLLFPLMLEETNDIELGRHGFTPPLSYGDTENGFYGVYPFEDYTLS